MPSLSFVVTFRLNEAVAHFKPNLRPCVNCCSLYPSRMESFTFTVALKPRRFIPPCLPYDASYFVLHNHDYFTTESEHHFLRRILYSRCVLLKQMGIKLMMSLLWTSASQSNKKGWRFLTLLLHCHCQGGYICLKKSNVDAII